MKSVQGNTYVVCSGERTIKSVQGKTYEVCSGEDL